MSRLLEIRFAPPSAWRATYLYVRGRQRGYLVLSRPDYGRRPYLRLGLLARGRRRDWTIGLPWLRWKPSAGRLRRFFWRRSERFYLELDGRYGAGWTAAVVALALGTSRRERRRRKGDPSPG